MVQTPFSVVPYENGFWRQGRQRPGLRGGGEQLPGAFTLKLLNGPRMVPFACSTYNLRIGT